MKEEFTVIRNFTDFKLYYKENLVRLQEQRSFEQRIYAGQQEFFVEGYCSICEKKTSLKVDLQWGDGTTPNWRERLECECGSNNRVRAAYEVMENLLHDNDYPNIYTTEQVTSFYKLLAEKYVNVIGSEFLRDGTVAGSENSLGIRHEDITNLTFEENTFDLIASFDVLEHVPNYKKAFTELFRVIKPKGHLLASFPFDAGSTHTVIRAEVQANGTINHILPAEYHGDPIDGSGCLCYQVFGWDVLDTLKQTGFSDAWVLLYWSKEKGYLGANQILIIARK